MESQTIIVILAVLAAVGYLIHRFTRTAIGRSGCGCGSNCPADKRPPCESGKDHHR